MQTVLIADDDEGIRALIETTLESPDCRVLLAEDGEAALALARRELPDLVILDWVMPKLTGPEIAERLHCDALTAQIPVILLTGMAREENRKRGLATGALAYLIKPFSPLQLLQIVQQVLAEKGDADVRGREVAAAGR
jgi:CheY-like chemotaxis protein